MRSEGAVLLAGSNVPAVQINNLYYNIGYNTILSLLILYYNHYTFELICVF